MRDLILWPVAAIGFYALMVGASLAILVHYGLMNGG